MADRMQIREGKLNNNQKIELEDAHKFFSVHCFNLAWDLIDKPDRTSQEEVEMLMLSFVSHWHWTQREDYTPEKASIAYWQIARIYTILGQYENAIRFAHLCLQTSQEEGIKPFFLAYAYEALARAETLVENRHQVENYLDKAKEIANRIVDVQEKNMLLDDLNNIHSH
jgi:tetratricopeptide (TPR) repeat protein